MTARQAALPNPARIELWWAALGAGLVVIACVVILLCLLSAFVGDIEAHLRAAGDDARDAAAHVSHASEIGQAARLIHNLGTELALQLAVLSGEDGANP